MLYSVAVVVYNIVLTLIFAGGAVCAALLLRIKKLPGFLALIAIFLSYIIDNTIVFCTEMIPAFADAYDRMFLETPSIKTVCFIVRISCMLYLLSRSMPKFTLTAVISLTALHAFALICVPLIGRPDWMVYLYYFSSQITIIGVCVWALIQLRKQNDADLLIIDNAIFRRVLLYFLIMTGLVLIEDTYVIFFVDVYVGKALNIFNRNFSENVLFAGFAIGLFAYTWKCVDEMASHVAIADAAASIPHEQMFDPVEQFAEGFNLTDREMEILRCLLDGKSQQEISQQLVIALGTVKTHTHNIYSKAGATNRSQIIAKFDHYLAQNQMAER